MKLSDRLYRGEAIHIARWHNWLRSRGWVHISLYGVTIGRWFIGAQRFEKEMR